MSLCFIIITIAAAIIIIINMKFIKRRITLIDEHAPYNERLVNLWNRMSRRWATMRIKYTRQGGHRVDSNHQELPIQKAA